MVQHVCLRGCVTTVNEVRRTIIAIMDTNCDGPINATTAHQELFGAQHLVSNIVVLGAVVKLDESSESRPARERL